MNMKKENRQLLKASELAFRNITVLLLCVLIGVNLDKYLSTKPIFIIVFSILAALYLVISLILLGSKEK